MNGRTSPSRAGSRAQDSAVSSMDGCRGCSARSATNASGSSMDTTFSVRSSPGGNASSRTVRQRGPRVNSRFGRLSGSGDRRSGSLPSRAVRSTVDDSAGTVAISPIAWVTWAPPVTGADRTVNDQPRVPGSNSTATRRGSGHASGWRSTTSERLTAPGRCDSGTSARNDRYTRSRMPVPGRTGTPSTRCSSRNGRSSATITVSARSTPARRARSGGAAAIPTRVHDGQFTLTTRPPARSLTDAYASRKALAAA